MRLKDAALDRLRDAVRTPDLSGTRYRLVGPIGAGGMGAVFEVEDEVLKRRLALKVVDVPLDGEAPAEALLGEARVLARLEHPGLVPVHDAGRLPDGRAFYAMKLVRGKRLDAALARAHDAAGAAAPLPEGVRARGVRERERRRPSRPQALERDGGPVRRGARPRLGPRAVAAAREPADASGTPGFMAPEQAAGGPVDARADVYGLGALLDAVLRVSPAPSRPKALEAIVARATAPDRDDRYPDVPALAADVTRLLDGERVEAHAEGPLERAGRLLKRHRVAVGLVAAYLLTRGLFILFRR